MEVRPGHFVPPVGLEDGATTLEHGERHLGVFP
jgi:hypothetical protein